MQPRQRELYYANLDDAGRHVIAVVSRDELNKGRWVVAVMFTSKKLSVRWRLPNYVPFDVGECGLTTRCVAQAESISVVGVDQIDQEYGFVGRLNDAKWRDLIRAIGNVTSAMCEPE